MTSLRARLLAAVTYVLVLAILAFGVPLALNLRARVNAEVRTQAQAQADLVAATAADLLAPAARTQLATLARTAARSLRGRVLVVDRSGNVLVDSGGPGEVGVSYESRPELERALSGHPVQIERASRTLGQEILATAVPIIHNGRTAGAVRVTQSVDAVTAAVRRIELALAATGLVVLALGLAAGQFLAAQIARPLRRLEAAARRVAEGDLAARAPVEGSREQRSLSRSFNEMTGRIASLLAAQRDFVADASHQLRTPLTGLRLRLEEARAMTAEGDVVAELDAAIGEVDRLAHTVDELLLLSRDGRRRPAGAAVDLSAVAADAVQRWSSRAAERRIVLRADRRQPAGEVWAARADVERALDALVENALGYSPPATTVLIVTAPGHIHVLDEGPGVSPGERELVFMRFRRGAAAKAGAPGHGLGLPIARELIREWGGEVLIDSRVGGGTDAAISFPAAADDPPAQERRFAEA
ncbi:MAG TPA: ATP-binding protein [Solirubrobacteraceae bacterium]|nr:ATP-binding protein [Solirubrobacteraceae bacterium]